MAIRQACICKNCQRICLPFCSIDIWTVHYLSTLAGWILQTYQLRAPYLRQNFKQHPFIFSHLRTFRAKIWQAIDEKDFIDSSGNYYKTAWDLAIMYPLLEMTGGQGCKFIDEILYVYNMENPLNDCIAHKELQNETAQQILKKTSHKQKFFSSFLLHTPKKRMKFKHRWISFYKKIITPAVYLLAIKKLFKKLNPTRKCPSIY